MNGFFGFNGRLDEAGYISGKSSGEHFSTLIADGKQIVLARGEILTEAFIPLKNTKGLEYALILSVENESNRELLTQILSTFQFFDETQDANNTPNWNFYITEELGFQFSYPAAWEILKTSHDSPPCTENSCDTSMGFKAVHLNAKSDTFRFSSISLRLLQNNGKSIRNYFNVKDYSCCGENVTPTYLGDRIMDAPITQIQGLEARRLVNPPIDNPLSGEVEVTWIIFEKDSKIYLIDIGKDLEFNPELFQTQVDHILSTFKFTE